MTVVLLHDLGAEEAGEPWRAAAPDGWIVPDLPGHGSTPAPRHGAYDPMGLTIDEFQGFGATARTLRAFIRSTHDLTGAVRDIMLPDPDVRPT